MVLAVRNPCALAHWVGSLNVEHHGVVLDVLSHDVAARPSSQQDVGHSRMPVKERELPTRWLVVADLGPWISDIIHLHDAVARCRELMLVVRAVLDVLDLVLLVSKLKSWLLHARVPEVDPLVSAATADELIGLQLVPGYLRLATVLFIFLRYIGIKVALILFLI